MTATATQLALFPLDLIDSVAPTAAPSIEPEPAEDLTEPFPGQTDLFEGVEL